MLPVHMGVRRTQLNIMMDRVISAFHVRPTPLIYGIGIADPGAVELTDDEVVALIEELGFIVEHRESGIAAPYIQDIESMLHNTYKASHWVARKR